VAALQTWRGADPHERCSVGITDDAFAEVVDTELQLGGMTAHRVAGTSLTRTAPGRLLSLVRDYVGERSWQSLAALIRHPDLLDPLTETLGTNSLTLLGALDQFRNDHQLVRVDDPWPPRVVKLIARQDHAYRLLPRALDWIDRWLAPLRRPATGLAVWCTAVRDVLAVIYPGSDVADCKDGALATGGANAAGEDLERLRGIALAGRLVESLERLAGVPEPLDLHLSAAAALEMLLQRLAEPIPVRDPHADGAVAITGWLDLALDDAAAVAVVGLNHPFVPQAVTADPFLPGALRSRLRVQDNQRRYARDAYALQLVYQSRRRCCLIVGRFGPDASPTPPSRLLAACDPATTVQRIHRLLDEPPAAPRPHSHWEPGREATHLPIPSAAAAPPLTCVSVTAFRDYLACPFRFYLRHVLRLRPLDDAAAELAANQFGDLVHTAVERFGESDDKGLSDPEAIEKSVIAQLQAYAHDEYGSAPAAALRLQIHQAELRLREFAHQQARRIADGWRIEQVEAQVDARHGVGITLEDGQQLLLKGRVDRIDFHPESGRWAILDYKTHGHQPLPAHFDRASGQWLDLQLPLYLQMLPALGIEEPEAEVQLGYFNLAQKASESGVHLAEFTPEELQSAATRARQVARGILAGDYQLDPETGSVLYDDYGMILQTGVAENLWIDEQPEADR
jgi:RecB family exonuclease